MSCSSQWLKSFINYLRFCLCCGLGIITSCLVSADDEKTCSEIPTPVNKPARSVLLLYDAPKKSTGVGEIYAIQMANLLHHFPVEVRMVKIEQYRRKMINRYDVTCYIGAIYQQSLPSSFLNDVMATDKPILWVNQNIWHLDWKGKKTTKSLSFTDKFGLKYLGHDGSKFRQVLYKEVLLDKSTADPQLQLISITDKKRVSVAATIIDDEGHSLPYIMRSGNFWYVADNPFINVGFSDRYLAFADILHPVLEYEHAENHRALLRIEDVAPNCEPQWLINIADTLYERKIPFIVSVIPQYSDPKGKYNNGAPTFCSMDDRPEFVAALKYMQERGGQMLCHGYSHQYEAVDNPDGCVTGEDAEFFRLKKNDDGSFVYAGALPNDSAEWAYNRAKTAFDMMKRHGLTPIGWNTPHYVASEIDYQQFARIFDQAFCRGFYFASASKGQEAFFLQQMAPYVITKDHYQFTRIPETLGYLDPRGSVSAPGTTPAEIARRAAANKVVRDGWASFYYHPMLGVEYLRETVDLLTTQGYRFTKIDESIK